jgi:hypothetical protein
MTFTSTIRGLFLAQLAFASFIVSCDKATFRSTSKTNKSSPEGADVQFKKDDPKPDPEAVVVSIKVSPDNPQMLFSQEQQFTATAVYDDNSEEDVTSETEWLSEAPEIADFKNPDAKGKISSNATLGQTRIVATFKEFTDDTNVTVITMPDRQRLNMDFSNPKIARQTQRGKVVAKIVLKNLRGSDAPFVATQIVQSVDFFFKQFVYGERTPSAVAGLFDQVIEVHNCYKFVPDVTQYAGQKMNLTSTDANNKPIVFDINYRIISRPDTAAKTDPVDTSLEGAAGHPDAIDAGDPCN